MLLSLGDTAAPSRRPDDLAPDVHDDEAQLADGGGDAIEQLYDSISVCLMLLMKLARRSTYERGLNQGLTTAATILILPVRCWPGYLQAFGLIFTALD